ncbi:MAG: hypothetical protein CL539_06305 [Alcanivorax sp.]|jgi:hypothetical protein|uniref:hypothetical protein n=1 Tax=uncultured Marinobacter sp. TaxID=187379 RepID=UPI000C98EB4A|nr:hypothetical protein [Alcanivorax sp.]
MDLLQCCPVMDLGVGAIAQLTEPPPEVLHTFRGRLNLQALGFLAGLLPDLFQSLALAGTGLGVG